MKRLTPILAALVLAAGCREQIADHPDLNAWMMRSVDDAGIRNAIISQRAVFPYHFVTGSDELNELGERDVKVLAEHYSGFPFELSIRRGDVGDGLYQARVETVRSHLERHGVDLSRVQISDAPPGGEGRDSESALAAFEPCVVGGGVALPLAMPVAPVREGADR